MSNVRDFYVPVKFRNQKFTATASQTIFNLTTISVPNSDSERLMVTIDGQKQPVDAYTINSPTQVTISVAMEGGEEVEFIVPGLG